MVSAGPPADVVDLCRWAAWRWAGPLATFLRAASPPNVVRSVGGPRRETAVYPGTPLAGTALLVVGPREDVRPLLAPEGSTLVVDPAGTRASRLADAWRDEGREVVTLGSEHSDAVRTVHWDHARAGACVVVGGRSAVWAPVPDLAAVVVIDEGDEALEDERAPTWNARTVALERARRAGAAVRLITPTPTVDALVAVGNPRPVAARRDWPRVEVVDQRDEEPGHGLLSAALADGVRRAVGAGEHAVCVLNRRGRARLLACHACHELVRCETCGATVAQRDEGLVCARCATTRPVVCLHCYGTRVRAVRPGITRVRDDLAALLPRTEVAAVDRATDAVPDAPVLIGTEAVLHRVAPTVGIVAFLELDQELLAPRAYAAEQALWLLVHGARLLGRGPLLVQTRLPDHEVVQAAVRGAPMLVTDAEADRRRTLGFPPFGGLAELRGEPDAVTEACAAVRDAGVTVLGPVADGTRALLPRAVARAAVRRARPIRRRRRTRPGPTPDRRGSAARCERGRSGYRGDMYPLRLFGDPVLKQRAREVEELTADLVTLVNGMYETMDLEDGVGLAAPQVGVRKRLFTFDLHEGEGPGVAINPEIVESEGEVLSDEGCLSVPGYRFEVVRTERVTMRGIDLDGNELILEGDDLLARMIQHEIDHLDGVLLLDRVEPDVRREALKEMRTHDFPTREMSPRRATTAASREPAPRVRLVFFGTPDGRGPRVERVARSRSRHRARRHPARSAARARERTEPQPGQGGCTAPRAPGPDARTRR